MSEYKELLKTEDLKNGQIKAYASGERELLVARIGGQFFAADNRCPHLGAKLADGKLEGTILTCPKHGSRFDLKDGHVVRWTDWSGVKLGVARMLKSPRPLSTYPTTVEGDRVLVKI